MSVVHPPDTLSVTALKHQVGLFCVFLNVLICDSDSSRSLKHSSETLLHFGTTASHSCCTSMIRISCPNTSQGCSIGSRSGDCRGHDMVETAVHVYTVFIKGCSVGTLGPKVCQDNTPHTITPAAAKNVNTGLNGPVLPCCCFLTQNWDSEQTTLF